MLEAGASPNVEDAAGWRPLHEAACSNSDHAVKVRDNFLSSYSQNPLVRAFVRWSRFLLYLTHTIVLCVSEPKNMEVTKVALFDISISDIDCRYIDTFKKYRYRKGDFGKYRYRY